MSHLNQELLRRPLSKNRMVNSFAAKISKISEHEKISKIDSCCWYINEFTANLNKFTISISCFFFKSNLNKKLSALYDDTSKRC